MHCLLGPYWALRTCVSVGIEHRLGGFKHEVRHPQTNGMIERFNERIADLVKQTRFVSAAELETTLQHYLATYNHRIPQHALNRQFPIQALKTWQKKKPELFVKWVYEQTGLDNYRLFVPEYNGKSKIDHVRDVLDNVLLHKGLPVRTVLLDTWYATAVLMTHVASKELIYYCPLKKNRLVDDSAGQRPYQRADSLNRTAHELHHGKLVKVKNSRPASG